MRQAKTYSEEHCKSMSMGHMARLRFDLYAQPRRYMEELWDLVKQPVKVSCGAD